MKGPCTPTCCTLLCASFFCFLLAGSEHEPPIIGSTSFGAEATPALNEAISSASGCEFTGGGRQCWGLVLKYFGLNESKSTSVMYVITVSREQYRDTVHLFIGTGCNLRKITFMSFSINYNNDTKHHGSLSQFIFKSVRSFILRFVFVPKMYR
jgi:hypothetical protein